MTPKTVMTARTAMTGPTVPWSEWVVYACWVISMDGGCWTKGVDIGDKGLE